MAFISSTRVRRSCWLPAALVTGALLLVGLSGPAVADDRLTLADTTERIGPGITLHHSMTLDSTGWYDQRVLSVDLSERSVHADLLAPEQVSLGYSTTSSKVNAAGAAAGINGDFSDVTGTEAPSGAEVKSGQLLKSADVGPWTHLGVGNDGIGRLVDMTVEATATFGGAEHPVLTFNTANFYGTVPENALVAYTSDWGAGLRARGVQDTSDIAEVLVRDGRVAAVNPSAADAAPIPEGGFSLVGRGTSAAALRQLEVGDEASLAYALKDEVARDLRFGLGSNRVLVKDGVVQPGLDGDESIAPRTAIGFKDGGRTMLLVTWDGPGGTGRGGVHMRHEAETFVELGAEIAFNMDGGGSTTMVARELGNPFATVRNVPSDGSERAVPNGVGVFVTPGSGRAEDLVISPDGDAARVFPGMHLPMTVRAVDDHLTPVPLEERGVRWHVPHGEVTGGVLRAPDRPETSLRVQARAGRAGDTARVRVLGRLHSLELSSRRLSIPDLETSATVAVTGRDAHGFATPVDRGDLDLEYDRSVIRIEPAAGGLKMTPLRTGATVVELRADGQTAKLPVTVGVETVELYRFDHPDEVSRWVTNGTAGFSKVLSLDPEGLKLTYAAQRNMGITKTPASTRIPVPGQPLRIRARYSATRATQFTNLAWYDADGVRRSRLEAGSRVGENAIEWTLPADTKFPVTIAELQVIETRVAQQAPGEVVFKSIEADLAPTLEQPEVPPLRPDPLISPDGRFSEHDDWTFATLSDVQFTAANPELTKVAIAALARIRRTDPDLVVLNGDIVDTGSAADVALARETLEAGGCDLVAVDEPTPPSTPNTVPCYYVPGNHESYLANGSQGTLEAWSAEFGRPYRTFDHKGTRFVLLNSAIGSLRSSDFDQLPMLEQALEDARSDRDVDNVLVFAHHPVDDPDEKKASQLGDRREVELIKKLLADFREDTDKGVAMIGSHAQIVDTHREEGVPYQVLPSSGKAPYGTPDRGGFTGYVRWSLDQDAGADEQWLTADVRAFAQEITLEAPEQLEDGRSAQVGGSIVQPSGVEPGSRVVPLAYPMSVQWSGSRCLAIGDDERAAERAGKVAILDPVTRELTALQPGTVEIHVTNESMREVTDGASLEPITASRTLRVLPSHDGRPQGGRPHCER